MFKFITVCSNEAENNHVAEIYLFVPGNLLNIYTTDPLREPLGCTITGGWGEQLVILFLELKD